MNDGLRFSQVEIELTLAGESNGDGQAYNRVELAVGRVLEEGEALAAKAYGDQIKELVAQLNASFDRDSVDDRAGNGTGISVADDAEQAVPA
jgi:hypothetical protein